jgi:hypothetical protein
MQTALSLLVCGNTIGQKILVNLIMLMGINTWGILIRVRNKVLEFTHLVTEQDTMELLKMMKEMVLEQW